MLRHWVQMIAYLKWAQGEKQALEDQELRVRRMKEEFQLQSEMAISDARVKVYERFEEESVGQRQSLADVDTKFEQKLDKGVVSSGLFKELLNTHNQQEQNVCERLILPELPITSIGHVKETSEQAVNKGDHYLPRQPMEHGFSKVLEEQNEITLKLVDQQLKSSLPPRKLDVFDGNPLNYNVFIKSFEQTIEAKITSNKDRIYFLEKFTCGEPNSLVHSCMYHDGQESYLKAKGLLKDRFGNPERVTAAYVNKVLKWPNIPSEDAAALNQYSLFLIECTNTLNDLHYTNEMEHSTSMKIIVSKLPFNLRL